MKNKINLIIVSLVLANLSLYAQEPAISDNKLALVVILDTSWSCERYLSDFVTLSRQAISSGLGTSDYIEVLSAHPTNTRIRIAQTIKNRPGEINGITGILKTIRAGFLTNATMSKALDIAFNRLEKANAQRQYKNAAVIIFSDGRLADSDASRTVTLSERFRKRGWSLYLTGTKETNKRLLVAANQNMLQWSLISEANPVIWLQKLQETSKPKQVEEPLYRAIRDETPTIPQEPREQDDLSEKIPAVTKSVVQKDAIGPGYEIIKSGKSEVLTAPLTEEAPVVPKVPEKLLEPPEEPAPSPAGQPADDKMKEAPAFWQRAHSRLKEISGRTLLWFLLPLFVLMVALGVILLRGTREARRWRADMNSRLKKSQPNDDGALIAKFNGQSYRLGKLDRFRSIHVGSDVNNTIRISDKSVEGRHLEIFKKDDQLMLRNLAKSPVIANNTEIKSGQRHQLIVPSIIKLNDKVKLNLELDRPRVHPGESRSNKDE